MAYGFKTKQEYLERYEHDEDMVKCDLEGCYEPYLHVEKSYHGEWSDKLEEVDDYDTENVAEPVHEGVFCDAQCMREMLKIKRETL
jgi:hypothetical protein